MNKSFFFGMLAGTLVGSVLALLFAPLKGADTRQEFSGAMRTAGRTVGCFAADVHERARGRVATIKQAI